ncbi:MAG: serine hydrolase domain-containing protein [Pseudomonadota bacterium]
MKVLSCLAAGFALVFSAMAQEAVQETEAAKYDRLDSRLLALASQDDVVGLAVAVIEDGEIRFARGYGQTRLGGDAVTAETVFRWASLSKGVASTAVARLAADGVFDLNDTVSSFGSSLRLPGGGEARATLDHILSHRIGIVPNAYDTRLEDNRDPADIRRDLGKLKAVCAVGECHTYQNVAFDAVSEVVEAAAGSPFAGVVEARLFKPLGMATASFGRSALEASASWAEPHVRRRRDAAPRVRTVKEAYYRVPAAGGANGSILDLARFAQAQMGLAQDVLPDEVLDTLHAPRIYTSREQSGMSRRYGGHLKDARYALGWRTYKYADTGYRVVGHRGAVEGYRSLILFDPDRDAGVVALWNSNARTPVKVQFEVMDMLYGLPDRNWLDLDAGH